MLQFLRRSAIVKRGPFFNCAQSHFNRIKNWNSCRTKVNYSSNSTNGRESSERWWAIAAMTLSIPALVWIYNNHNESPIHNNSLTKSMEGDAVVVEDLRALQQELSYGQTETASSNGKGITPANKLIPLIRTKYLLIGGGTASFAAMEEIRRLEPDADILIVSEEEHPPYFRPPLSKELWFSKNKSSTLKGEPNFTDWHGEEKSIFFQPSDYFETRQIDQVNNHKTRLLLGRRAVELDVDGKTVTIDDGRAIAFDKVLLATGGRPRMLPELAEAPVEVRRHVSTFRSIEDFLRLRSALGFGKHITIIGGGFLGSELAVALAQHSQMHLNGQLEITQFFPEEGNMALVFPRYLSRWTMSRVRRAGVKIIPNSHLTMVDYDKDNDKVIISLNNGTQLKADHVLVAIGIEPNVELAQRAGLELDRLHGGIVTNAELQARVNVFAAGDAISFHDTSLGVRRRVEHYDHAVLSGKAAAANMVNPAHRKPYIIQSMFWSDLGPEVGYEAVGLVDANLTTVGVWAEATRDDSPRAADLDPSDIRSMPVGSITSRAVDPPGLVTSSDSLETKSAPSVVPSPLGERAYGKGVVFYVKDRRVVGMVMFNLFNRVALARSIISKPHYVDDLQTLVELFNINEVPTTTTTEAPLPTDATQSN